MPTPSGLPTYQEYKLMMAEGTELENLGDILDKKYKLAEAKATKRYMDELYVQGKSISDQDFETFFNEELANIEKRYIEKPLTPGYGDYKELVGGLIPDAPAYNIPPAIEDGEPTLATAMSRQQKASPAAKTIQPAVSIQWENIEKDMVEGGELDPVDAKANTTAIKKTYEYILSENPEANPIDVFETVAEQLQGIGDVATKKIPMDTSGVFFDASSKDPYIAAFQQQITDGEIPDYDSVQSRFLRNYLEQKDEQFKNENYDDTALEPTEYKTIKTSMGQVSLPADVIDYIRGTDPRLVPPVYNEKIDAAIREDGQTVKRQMLVKPEKRKADINAVLEVKARKNSGSDNWFLDPDKKAMVLADPESFVDQGFFTDESRIGGTRETIGSWALRSALSPLNAIAGFAQEEVLEPAVGAVMGGVAEGLEAVGAIPDLSKTGESYFDPYAAGRKRKEYRAREQALYENNPVLANIALNKGFTGEGMEISDALNLEGLPKYVVIGGSFAADILDPTFAIGTGVVKGSKNVGKLRAAQKAFGTTGDVSAYKAFASGLADEVAGDFNVLSPFAKKYKPEPFNITNLMTDELAKTARSIDLAQTTKSWEDYERALFREGLDETPHAQQMLKYADENIDIEAAVQRSIREAGSPELTKIWQDFSDKSRLVDDIVEYTQRNTDEIEAARLAGRTPKTVVPIEETIRDVLLTTGAKTRNVDTKWLGEFLGPRTDSFVDWIEAGSLDNIKKGLYTASARSALFEATPQLVDLKDVVTVTKNTYAHTDQVPKILDEARRSEMGQMLENIGKSPVRQGAKLPKVGESLIGGIEIPSYVNARLSNYFKLDNDAKMYLDAIIESDVSLSQTMKSNLKKELELGQLSFDSYRFLIDHNVDLVARNMQEGITVKDLERMRDPQGRLLPQVEALFTPVEARVDNWLTRKATKILRSLNPEPVWIHSATINQRKALDGIKQKLSALDSNLRRDVRGLMSNEEVQIIYGLTEVPATRLDAVGVAIVGPKLGDEVPQALKNAQTTAVIKANEWAVNRLLFKLDYVENLTDSVGGVNRMFQTNLFSQAGQQMVDLIVVKAATQMIEDPQDYVKIFNQMFVDIEQKVMNKPKMLGKGVVASQINKVTPEFVAAIEGELFAGQYYFARSSDIISEEILKLVSEDSINALGTYQNLINELGLQKFIGLSMDDVRGALNNALINSVDNTVGRGDLKLEIFADLVGSDKSTIASAFYGEAQSIAKYGMKSSLDDFDDVMEGLHRDLLKTFMATAGKTQQQQLVDLYRTLDPLISKIIDDADNIIQRNGLNTNVYGSMDDVVKMTDDLMSDKNLNWGRAVFGEKVYDQMAQELTQGRNTIMNQKLDQVIRNQILNKNGWMSVKRWLNVISSFRYTVLLGMRPRFHMPNVLTANAITYSTVGRLTPNVYEGFNVAFRSMDPSGAKYFSEAVKSPSGKIYTYGEISDLIYSSGIRSEHDFVQNALADENMVAFLSVGRKGDTTYDQLRRASGRLGEFTTQEDVMFRASIMIDALREGRSEAEALELAKISMFDYNNMSKAEKQMAANYFIFYSFARQNYGTLVKSVVDPTKFKRYLNILKFKRGSEMLFSELEGRNYYDNIYLPDYLKSNRAIISVSEGEEYDYYLTSPPIPAIDSMVFFADILEGRFQDLAQKQLLPELKLLAGIEDPFKQSNSVPPEMVNVLSKISDDPNDIAQYLQIVVGGKVTPRNATGERGGVTVGSGTYRFDLDQSQQAAYLRFIRSVFGAFVDMTLTGTTAKDYSKIFMTEGTSYQKNNALEQFLSVIGATTPMKGMKPQTTMTSQSYARKRAIQEELNKARRDQKAIEEEIMRREMNK